MRGIGTEHRQAKALFLESALAPFRSFLSNARVETQCQAAGHRWRHRVWDPTLTVLACVWKQLHAAASARQVEDWAASLALDAQPGPRDGSDFCAARKRLPERIFQGLAEGAGRCASARAGRYFLGLSVWLVDGTTLRAPNTHANEWAFGRSRNQTRSSRSPILRVVALVCAGCGAVLNVAWGAYAVSEWEIFLGLLARALRGGLFVADRHYASFMMFALTRLNGSHALARHGARRRARRLKRHAKGDELVEWLKPKTAHVARADLLPACPERIEVRVITCLIERRGYRTWELKLATTLLDPLQASPEALIELYLERWNIELDLRTLKTHYGMARLSGKTPEIVVKELYSIVLAYNGVLAVLSETGAPVRGQSHTRARRLLLTYAERMAWADPQLHEALYRRLLQLLATATVVPQPRPPQPRAIVQRPSTYPVLMSSRNEWRKAYLSA